MAHLLKIILFTLITQSSFAQNDLERMSLLDNKIEMLVPKSFHVMTEDEYKFKYPNPKRRASLILTDKNLEVNVVIDHLKQYELVPDQVQEFTQMQLAAVQKSHPEGKLLDNGVHEINGKKTGFFKLITQASDQKVFNYFLFTDLENKVLLISLNCSETKQPAWEKTFDNMISTLKLIK